MEVMELHESLPCQGKMATGESAGPKRFVSLSREKKGLVGR